MSHLPKCVRIICTNPAVAESLREVALEVVPEKRKPLDQHVYDLAPAVYLHVPRLVFARPYEGGHRDAKADAELQVRFVKALREHGGLPLPYEFPLFRELPLMPELRASIVAGLVLGVAFAEKVEVDDRYALLPWEAWRKAERTRVLMSCVDFPTGSDLNLLQWRRTWEVPPELLMLDPSLEYTADLLNGLLPAVHPPTSWWVPEAGKNPSVESLRRTRILRQQVDLGDVRSPGFYFEVQKMAMQVLPAKDAPLWAANLLPTDGQTSWVSIGAHDCKDAQEQTVTATAKLYGVTAADVQIVPLFVNRLGHWLGCAVRIGKGAVLVLPEFPDKAEPVKQLATGLWEPVQEWLRAEVMTKTMLTEQSTAQGSVPPHTAGPVAPAIDKGQAGEVRRKGVHGAKKRKPYRRGRPPKQPRKRRPRPRRRGPRAKQTGGKDEAPPKSPATTPPSGEWVGPMTKVEMARRVLDDRKARWRKVGPMFPPERVQEVTARTYRFRIDQLDEPTRDRCRNLFKLNPSLNKPSPSLKG